MTIDACGAAVTVVLDQWLIVIFMVEMRIGLLILVPQVRCLPELASFHPRRSTTLAKRFVFHFFILLNLES